MKVDLTAELAQYSFLELSESDIMDAWQAHISIISRECCNVVLNVHRAVEDLPSGYIRKIQM